MDFGFSKEEESFRQEVRELLLKELPPNWTDRPFLPMDECCRTKEIFEMRRQLAPKLGEKGWLTISWPQQYGGQGRYVKDLISQEEIYYLGAPARDEFSQGMVGPAIIHHGSEEQKSQHLTPIARAEKFWCLGLSEPQSGSDVGAAQTRAVEDGNNFVINGQKIWTSAAPFSDWCFLLVRTDPDAPKHKGLSVILVDLKTPGITIRPITDMTGGSHFAEVFYEDVKVPRENLLGTKNQGWGMVMGLLLHERAWIEYIAGSKHTLELVAGYLKGSEGEPTKNPAVRQQLAELYIETEIARFICYRVAWLQDRGITPTYEAAMSNLFGTNLVYRVGNTAMQLLGLYGQLSEGSARVPLWGTIPHIYLDSYGRMIGSGTSEIQKNLVALMGLGFPRAY